MASNSFKVKNSIVLTPKDLSTLVSPEAGDLACDINDNNKIKRYDANAAAWVEVGSGGVGGVDIFFVQDFESASLSSFTQTGLVLSQTDPLKGKVSAVLNHQAGTSPANDQSFKQIISVDRKFRGQTMVMRLDSKSDASQGNLVINVKDETNNANLVASEQLQLSNEVSGKKTSVSFTIPETCASLSYTITALPESGKVSRIDDIICELAETALLETSVEVPVVTGWQGYTPTFQGFGTPTNVEFEWRQVGENVEIRGKFTSGTATAVEARVGLPAGLTSAGTSLIPSLQVIGGAFNAFSSGTGYLNNNKVLIEPSVNYLTLQAPTTSALTKSTGSNLVSAGGTVSFFASVPCSGLSATTTKTIPLTQSGLVQEADSYIQVDTYAGYGSTNTAIPYFSNLRSSLGDAITRQSSATLGDSYTVNYDGVYTFTFSMQSASGVGTSIGLTKNLSGADLTTNLLSLSSDKILQSTFSPTVAATTSAPSVSWTGYLLAGDVIRPHTNKGVPTTAAYAFFSAARQGSLKQVAVSSDSKITIPTSELRFEGASSRGSTATAIVKFDTLAKLRGDAFTVNNDSVLGTSIVMKKAGRLSVSATLIQATGDSLVLSKNQAVLTTQTTTASEILSSAGNNSTGSRNVVSWTGDIAVGDILRISASAAPTSNAVNSLNLSFQEQEIAVSVTNTLPQFSESDSSVRVDTANGYGSTGTKIRRFSNVRDNIGADIEYVPSAVNGDSFVVKSDGIYNISFSDNSGSAQNAAITKNASNLSTDPINLSAAEILALDSVPAGGLGNPSWQGFLVAGDIIRAQTTGGAASNNAFVRFTISKVGKPNVTGVDVTPFVNVPQPEWQSALITKGTSGTASTYVNTAGFTVTQSVGSGIISIDNSTGRFTALKTAKITAHAGISSSGVTGFIYIGRNAEIGRGDNTPSTASLEAAVSRSFILQPGEYFTFTTYNVVASIQAGFTAEALSDQILTAPETFSTDTASLTYAGSGAYTLSTLENAPVGTYITFTYAANTNTRTQTTTPPSQSPADMNANGIQIFARAYNAASTSGNPSAIAIQIGKGLKGKSLDLYKSVGKVTAGSLDLLHSTSGTIAYGVDYKDYNEKTGILVIDAGIKDSAITNANFRFTDVSNQNNGYLVINASKNPALTGIGLGTVAARAVNGSGQVIPAATLTTVTYDAIKTYDTHGALNTSTGVFTAPESGYYQVSASFEFSSSTYAINNIVYCQLYKNSILNVETSIFVADRAVSYPVTPSLSTGVYLAKGDTLYVQLYNARTGGTSLVAASVYNFFSIHKTSLNTGN